MDLLMSNVILLFNGLEKYKDAIEIIGKFLALLIALFGLIYLRKRSIANWKQSEASQKEAHDARRSFELEKYIRAIEHINSESVAIRVGGIEALRLLYYSKLGVFPAQITSVLVAFIRERAVKPAENERNYPYLDVQAAVNVFGKRPKNIELEKFDMRNVHLSGYLVKGNFSGVDFQNSNFDDAEMFGVDLSNSNLNFCSFKNTNLVRAKIIDCTVEDASFTGADIMAAIIKTQISVDQVKTAKNWKYAESSLIEYYISRKESE